MPSPYEKYFRALFWAFIVAAFLVGAALGKWVL